MKSPMNTYKINISRQMKEVINELGDVPCTLICVVKKTAIYETLAIPFWGKKKQYPENEIRSPSKAPSGGSKGSTTV